MNNVWEKDRLNKIWFIFSFFVKNRQTESHFRSKQSILLNESHAVSYIRALQHCEGFTCG